MSSVVAFFGLFQFISIKKSIPALFLLIWLTLPAFAQDRLTGKTFATRTVVMAQHGMACTSHPLSMQVANAMEGLVEPDMNGSGGDLFPIFRDAKTKKLYGLNASRRSPYSLTLTEFQKRGLTHIPGDGPLPVSTPGGIDGWFTLHKRFCKKPMIEILSHAIRYAREGFPIHDEAGFIGRR